jgi:hypothetical protein
MKVRNTVKSGLSCETVKKFQNEKFTLFDLEYGKKPLKNVENEKCTLYVLDLDKKTENNWKMLSTPCMTWNMPKN